MIIAFGHKKYVGKDTAAKFFATEYRLQNPGKHVVRIGFADKLKEVCYELYWWAGMQNADFYEENPSQKENFLPKIGKTVRQVWIEMGNKIREIYENTWVEEVINKNADLILIKDLRYPNEVEAVHRMGGFVVKINRPDVIQTNDIADCALDNFHDWDFEIENKTIAGLHSAMKELYARTSIARKT